MTVALGFQNLVKSMKKNSRKMKGFILMEVLIGLTILGITLLLFWQSYNNQVQINEKLTNAYAIDRLEYDLKVLKEISKMNELSQGSYGKLSNFKWNDLEFKGTSLDQEFTIKLK